MTEQEKMLSGKIYDPSDAILSDNCYANFNFTVLDTCPVRIGNNVYFGPNCTIATPVPPLRWQERTIKYKEDGTAYDDEYGKPITIGANCWIASNVVITGGVTIGEGCVIGVGGNTGYSTEFTCGRKPLQGYTRDNGGGFREIPKGIILMKSNG